MTRQRRMMAAIFAALLSLGLVACEDTAGDPLMDDPGVEDGGFDDGLDDDFDDGLDDTDSTD